VSKQLVLKALWECRLINLYHYRSLLMFGGSTIHKKTSDWCRRFLLQVCL